MGSAVAEQAANKGVRVGGGIREGRPRCGRNKGGRPRCGRNKEGRPRCGRNNEGRSVAGESERPFFCDRRAIALVKKESLLITTTTNYY